MGLDIYFYKYRKGTEMTKDEAIEKGFEYDEDWNGFDNLNRLGENEDGEDTYVNLKEVGYFRKVNFLVPRLYGGAEDCENVEISLYDLKDLAEDCDAILQMYKKVKKVVEANGEGDFNPKQMDDYYELLDFAESTLPTTDGFFFGGTDYDEYYFSDVKAVKEWVEETINNLDWDNDVLLMHCWW